MPVGPIKDPLISIKPGPELIEFVLKNVKDAKEASDGIAALKSSTKKQRSNVLLRLNDVRWLNDYLKEHRKCSEEKIYLHELLEGSEVELPTPEVTPRNPELEARIQKLMSQQSNRDYKAMTKSVDSIRKHFPEDTISYQSEGLELHRINVFF